MKLDSFLFGGLLRPSFPVFAICVFAGLSLCGEAWADDDFFELSPGKLSEAHAEFDSTDKCTKCHELGKGVTNFLCLDCHQHRDLRDAIRAGRGLHANFKQNCRECHTEHKGRNHYIIDWGPVGGRRNFDHGKTGFDLEGLHKEVTCSACHKKRLKSGRTSYAALPRTCDGCHQNPHRFTTKALRKKCESCHGKGGQKKSMSASELPFDHAKRTGVALDGKHTKAKCRDCHKGARMGLKRKRTCFNCHDSPHGRAYKRAKCTECHTLQRDWKKPTFSHEETKFPLRAKHATKRCSRCHDKPKSKPKTQCQSCHKDPHRKRFKGQTCASCHGLGGSKAAGSFPHARKTGFALTAGHAKLRCRSCHRGRGPRRFEKFDSSNCMDCHEHENVHGGQFKDTPCGQCHKEGGSGDVTKFNHDTDARFALTGFHDVLEQQGKCRKCHPSDAFRTGKTECKDCHEDSHEGQLGTDCAQCHADDVHFKETSKAFDHNAKTKFALEAKHRTVECEKCHPRRNYKTGKSECADCHADDEPHDGMLGSDCERCHIPDDGAPKFVHNDMTEFVLTGAHLSTKCERCHQKSYPDDKSPSLGWAATVSALEPDLSFPTPGTTCAECHFDAHEGAYGPACESCHSTESFGAADAAVHDTGAFRLLGTHDLLRCERCHEPQRPLEGLGVMCQECHRNDDDHNNSLGPFCGRCHSQFDWSPPRFNHSVTGTILRGAHKTAQCRDCHGVGNYVGTPTDCSICHQTDAMAVPDPMHMPPTFDDCQQCHTEVAFSPARRYHPWWPLSGAHVAVDCSNCHTNGYMGTPTDCVGCHQTDYDATQQPNHMLAGFGTECQSCHTTAAFEGARYQHQTFIRQGSHRVLDCEQCHTGGDYTSAFGGMVMGFECESCHSTGAPADARPGDHDQLGYPQGCDLCHNQLGWLPARRPR